MSALQQPDDIRAENVPSSGVISSSKGGCFSLELVANHTNFAPRNENGLASLGFPTIFPLGFRFTGGSSISNCEDIRNQVLAFNVIMSALLFFLFRPHGLAVFWSLVCIGFWHVTLFSQPRSSPPSLSFGFGTFLPTLFICYAFWRLAFRFTLPVFLHKAPLEAAVWYLGPFWVGVLFNLTFDRIPISRLVASDISQRAGGVASLVIMIIVLATCVITQVIVIRKTGWLPHYLKWYIIGGLVLMVLALLPNLQLRIHHYIFAMVFLPGTAFPTRLSAIFQGVLLGMFLNGAAAFGYDSILQTAAEVCLFFFFFVDLLANNLISLLASARRDARFGNPRVPHHCCEFQLNIAAHRANTSMGTAAG